ncbi:hypothetical protein QQS21_008455 [Conoideocrella luteorostrata]|uniref:Peptidase S8/S53 domain-containing protein n=1 Tax=Conoideocrella luteorostrata TaxID=1105319 RepID=A0AAJ0CIT7_9HYPO|nr:hypothetical protein QQS21_008455 [Conoideocrella luteorostrata]
MNPALDPAMNPALNPALNPAMNPALDPAMNPALNPALNPAMNPELNPAMNPALNPALNPAINPAMNPAMNPAINPAIGFRRGLKLSQNPADEVLENVSNANTSLNKRRRNKANDKWQSQAHWGLARLSHSKSGQTTYRYDGNAGKGTCVIIIDSGIDAKHPEFGGRAKFLKKFSRGLNTDVLGRGTRIASVVGSKTYGVAKRAKIFGIKAIDDISCGLEYDSVIAAMEYTMKIAPTLKCPKGVAVLIGLGGFNSTAFSKAAKGLVDAGYFLTVAAGDGGVRSGSLTPALDPRVCTVGATDREDRYWKWSNFGTNVNILAPGVDIPSLTPGLRHRGTVRASKATVGSSTSLAAAHVAGLAAYLLGLGKDAGSLCDYIVVTGIRDVINYSSSNDSRNETANVLANNGFRE